MEFIQQRVTTASGKVKSAIKVLSSNFSCFAFPCTLPSGCLLGSKSFSCYSELWNFWLNLMCSVLVPIARHIPCSSPTHSFVWTSCTWIQPSSIRCDHMHAYVSAFLLTTITLLCAFGVSSKPECYPSHHEALMGHARPFKGPSFSGVMGASVENTTHLFYVCMHVFMCLCVYHVCVWSTCMYVCMHACGSACMYHVCFCMHVFMVCMQACLNCLNRVHVCMHACMHDLHADMQVRMWDLYASVSLSMIWMDGFMRICNVCMICIFACMIFVYACVYVYILCVFA